MGSSEARGRGAGLLIAATVLIAAGYLVLRPAGTPPTEAPPTPTAPGPADSPAEAPRSPAPPAAAPDPGPDAPAPTGADAATPDRLALSVEVVDARGERVRDGTLHLTPGMEILLRLEELNDRGALLRPQDLAAANPLVVRGLPASLAGLTLSVQARVPGFAPGEVRKVALGAAGTTAVRLVVEPARSLEVEVVDAGGGAPVAGARVLSTTELRRREIDAAALPGDRGTGWATTDAAGRALITDLGPGGHDLEVTADGFLSLTPRGVEPGPERLRLRMERRKGGATLRVLVRGPTGDPVPGVRVELVLFDRDSKLHRDSDGRGVAEFEGLPPGHALVRVDFPRWLDLAEERGWPESNVGELNEPLELADGDAREVVLGFRGGTGILTCVVVDAAGAPAPGVEVTFSGATYESATTDAKGEARFEGLAPGAFRLSLERKGDWMDGEERTLEDGARREVRLALGDRVVRGRVVRHGAEGTGIAGATVSLSGPRYAQVRTGADGAFSVAEALPGDYEVWVVADRHATGLARLSVPDATDPPPIAVALHRGGRIRIRFARPPGGDLPDSALSVRDADGKEIELRRDETGEFLRETWEQPPGAYTVEFTPPGGATWVRAVEVKDGEDAVVVIGD